MQLPKTTYHRARYIGADKSVASGGAHLHNIAVHVSPRGRVGVRIMHGFHWEKSSKRIRYYNMGVFEQDWHIVEDVKL